MCLVVAALMIHASMGDQAEAACRLIAPGNAVGSIAAIAALIAFPAAAHPYVAALAVAGTGCAVFATLEYQATARLPRGPSVACPARGSNNRPVACRKQDLPVFPAQGRQYPQRGRQPHNGIAAFIVCGKRRRGA